LFVACKEIRDGDRVIQPGELCPQVANWPTLRALISGRFVKEIPEKEAAGNPHPAASSKGNEDGAHNATEGAGEAKTPQGETSTQSQGSVPEPPRGVKSTTKATRNSR
jgi:hypothetical protein